MKFKKELAQVMTPKWVVKDMLTMFDLNVIGDLNTIVLEPSCGTGNFVIEILKAKIRYNRIPNMKANDMYLVVYKSICAIKAIDKDIDMVLYCRRRIAKFIDKYLSLYHPTYSTDEEMWAYKLKDYLIGQAIICNIRCDDFLEMCERDKTIKKDKGINHIIDHDDFTEYLKEV